MKNWPASTDNFRHEADQFLFLLHFYAFLSLGLN